VALRLALLTVLSVGVVLSLLLLRALSLLLLQTLLTLSVSLVTLMTEVTLTERATTLLLPGGETASEGVLRVVDAGDRGPQSRAVRSLVGGGKGREHEVLLGHVRIAV